MQGVVRVRVRVRVVAPQGGVEWSVVAFLDAPQVGFLCFGTFRTTPFISPRHFAFSKPCWNLSFQVHHIDCCDILVVSYNLQSSFLILDS